MSRLTQLLIVDDDPVLRDHLDALGATRGFAVRWVNRPAEACRNALEENFDAAVVALCSTPMLGGTGLETLRELKRVAPQLPVVVLSSQGNARNIVAAMKFGASDFLCKPLQPDELEAAIRKAIDATAQPAESASRERTPGPGESDLRMVCGDDPKMREVRGVIELVADTDITVLIRGESGTGKELVARALHRQSSRCQEAFVKVNCAALPSELLESELFGFEKGAFTGAQRRKLGKFEYANHGTIFLDEISEMPPALQAKLLQVLQDGEFAPLGGRSDVRVDTRVIAATHRDLETAVERGDFRSDLFYRLNVVTVALPPLRERSGAIALLAEHFRKLYNAQYERELNPFSERALQLFGAYSWPGNVRELENFVKRAVVLGSEEAILDEVARRLPRAMGPETRDGALDLGCVRAELNGGREVDLKGVAKRVAQVAEKRVIERVLDRTRWNRKEAAKRLRISYKALLYKMKESGLGEVR